MNQYEIRILRHPSRGANGWADIPCDWSGLRDYNQCCQGSFTLACALQGSGEWGSRSRRMRSRPWKITTAPTKATSECALCFR
jgi:hypothetical protein